MFCRQCGTNLPEGARFCTSCGAQQVAAPAPPPNAPPIPGICTGCGVALTPGRRFCTNCGTPVGGTAIAAPYATPQAAPQYAAAQPQYSALPAAAYAPSYPPTVPPNGVAGPYAGYAAVPGQRRPAGGALKSLSPLSLGALGGFAAAVIATFLDWITVTGFGSANGWEEDARYQFADWLDRNFQIDAILVVILAAGGALLLVGSRIGLRLPRIPYAAPIAGAALAVVGILEFWYIRRFADDIPGGDIVKAGTGLYVLIAGGIAAAVCAYLEERRATA